MTDVQTTYEKLKEIADNDPLTFREEWNKGAWLWCSIEH